MEPQHLTTNLIVQYIAVGLILASAAVWTAWKFYKIRKHGPKSCCGCSLSQSCGKKTREKPSHARH